MIAAVIPRVIIGDCLDVLADLPAGSVQCCVTSPPYFGLRDYGVPPSDWPAIEFAPMPGLPPISVPAMSSCLGLEPDPWAFVGHLVEVFRRVRRVLADDGLCFINLGDSYCSSPPGNKTKGVSAKSGLNGVNGASGKYRETLEAGHKKKNDTSKLTGLKPKDIIGIPWRVAFALQADGWFLRQDVIWSKPNPMPESVRDRCTKAHEYVFLLAKSERYFWDAGAVAEVALQPIGDIATATGRHSQHKQAVIGQNGHISSTLGANHGNATRNRRSVWSIATQPYSGSHFATFPPALVEPCILAGSRRGDTVIDPFGGTGTVGSVAAYHDRRAVLIDINPANEALMGERLEKHEAPLFDGLARPVQESLI